MEARKKLGWTAFGIVGFVFAPIGLLFSILGPALYFSAAGRDAEDSLVFLCVFGGMGALFLILGICFLFYDIRRRSRMRRAIDMGERVMAKIAGVNAQTNVTFNGRHPYVIECHYTDPDTGAVHVWHSRYLFFDPTDILKSAEVPVYLDRYDFKNAYVDIDSVLPEVQVH